MKRILVSGYIGFDNFGDEAIFYALANHLKQKNAYVSVLCANKKKVKEKYQVKTYNYKKFSQIIKAIFRCDILFSGGGSLLQNKTSNFSLIYYCSIILLAKIFFKKVVIFAQGIEPVKGKFWELFLKFVLSKADLITLRDNNSLKYLNKLKLKANLVSDPIYSLIQDEDIEKNKKGLIVQLRKTKEMKESFLADLAVSISKFNGEIKVLSLQDDFDKEICSLFIEELKKQNKDAILVSNLTIDKTLALINSAEYMISQRLHGAIASSGFQTKTFALIYDEKIKTLTDELSIDNIDINNYEKETLDKKIDNFFNNNQNEPHYSFRRFNWDYFDDILEKGEKL